MSGKHISFRGIARALLLCLALGAAAGCSSVNTSSQFNGLALADGKENVCHMNASISGLYLFSFPLLTGSALNPEKTWPEMMLDTVNLPNATNMLSQHAQSLGATELHDLHSVSNSTWIFLTYIFWWKSETLSANAVK